jgi:hypothetical protein
MVATRETHINISKELIYRLIKDGKKPNRGKIKANCNTNLKVNGKLGLGAIFRDDDGQVLASATWEMPDLCDPTTAEAYALYLTTRMVVDCCFTRVEFECDSSIVVKRVNEP